MKIFLLKDVAKVGFAGEIIKVKDGYAKNFLFPKKLGIELTAKNEAFYLKRVTNVVQRKEALASETNMFSEKISHLKLTLQRKIHDNKKLYAAVNASDIVELLAKENVKISKSQVKFDKSIKSLGEHKITIKLSSKLQPELTLKVVTLKG